nr:esterase-like activity of phytase family protein [Pelagerythrobacter marinus]
MALRPVTVRRIAALFIALLAAPGTWLRSPLPEPDYRPILAVERLEVERDRIGPFTIDGAWALTSPNSHFGGYSGLVSLPDGRLLAVSDHGRFLRFDPPGGEGRAPVFGAIGGRADVRKYAVDAEAVTSAPGGRDLWVAYEGSNSIVRFDPGLEDGETVTPAAMRGWSGNGGPESLARLPDGRFLAIEEGAPTAGSTGAAVLFPADPVDGGEPIAFRYASPEGFRPSDAAALPDGRVLVLHRRVTIGLPFAFETAIAVADPEAIRAGATWRGEVLATIGGPLPADNFEGMAVVPRADGSVTIWLISDDNRGVLQRTLLYRLSLDPGDLG